MIISNCPRCHEGFRVPASSLPDNVYGRCPWCHETFPIADVLRRIPPQLEIISADGQVLQIERASMKAAAGLELIESSRPVSTARSTPTRDYDSEADFEVDDGLVIEADEKTVRGAISDTIVDEDWQQRQTEFDDCEQDLAAFPVATSEDPHSTLDGSTPSPLHSMNVSSKGTVRSRRKGSGIGTLVGIVLGGLASVPIAGLLLMMLGKTPDWGFWPFDGRSQGNPSVRAAAPFPQQELNRETTAPTGTQLRFNREASSAATIEDPARTAAAQISGDAVSDSTTDSESVELANPSQASGISLVEAAPDADGTSLRSVPVSEPSQETRVAVSTTPSNSFSPDPDPAPAIVNDSIATPSPRTISQSEAATLILKASQQLDAMARYEGPEPERNRRLSVTYQTIASAASSLAPPGDSLKSLATKIAASQFRDELASAGWNWLHLSSRELDGVALIGRTSTNDEGSFLTWEGSDSIALDLDQPVPDNQEVLVLGVLMERGKRLHVIHVEPIPQ